MKIVLTKDFSLDGRKSHFIDMTLWFASYQLDKLSPFLDEEVEWSLVGDKPIEGRTAFITALGKMSGNSAAELSISHVLVDGNIAAISGKMKMKNGKNTG